MCMISLIVFTDKYLGLISKYYMFNKQFFNCHQFTIWNYRNSEIVLTLLCFCLMLYATKINQLNLRQKIFRSNLTLLLPIETDTELAVQWSSSFCTLPGSSWKSILFQELSLQFLPNCQNITFSRVCSFFLSLVMYEVN